MVVHSRNSKMLRAIVSGIDRVVDFSGRKASWLVAVLIVAITYEVIARYVFAAPTKWSFELSYMIGGTAAIVGLSYVLLKRNHVRVDIIQNRFPAKVKLIIEILFTLLFFFPLMAVLLYFSIDKAILSLITLEHSTLSIWEPIMFPYRMAIPIALVLLTIQGAANFIRDAYLLIKGRPL